jgi:hypothetical protein
MGNQKKVAALQHMFAVVAFRLAVTIAIQGYYSTYQISEVAAPL